MLSAQTILRPFQTIVIFNCSKGQECLDTENIKPILVFLKMTQQFFYSCFESIPDKGIGFVVSCRWRQLTFSSII